MAMAMTGLRAAVAAGRLLATVLAATPVLSASGAAAAAGLFDNMNGAWAGEGMLTLSSGSSERIVCRATYSVNGGGNQLVQELRCASDSYALDIASTVNYSPDTQAVEGAWSVTNYGVGGSVSGVVEGGWVSAWVQGTGFLALLQISISHTVQNVVIKPDGFDVTEVSVTLRKS
jgi:hypothetical protein